MLFIRLIFKKITFYNNMPRKIKKNIECSDLKIEEKIEEKKITSVDELKELDERPNLWYDDNVIKTIIDDEFDSDDSNFTISKNDEDDFRATLTDEQRKTLLENIDKLKNEKWNRSSTKKRVNKPRVIKSKENKNDNEKNEKISSPALNVEPQILENEKKPICVKCTDCGRYLHVYALI